ncbi:MAG: AmmeMemoRadiSam system protein B [bacterium]
MVGSGNQLNNNRRAILLLAGLLAAAMAGGREARSTIPIYPYTSASWRWVFEQSGEYKISNAPKTVIAPHDIASYAELMKFYNGLGRVVQPEVVAIIGPNHRDTGTATIQTTRSGFATTNGILAVNQALARRMVRDGVARDTADTFINEHAFTIEAEYIQQVFPQSQILPLAIRSDATAQDADGLAGWLAQNLPTNSLVIGSLDFSHYLTKARADINDAKTLRAMRTGEIDQLPQIDSACEFVDSPIGLRILLRYAQIKSADDLVVVRHDNSADIWHQPNSTSTTGHFYLAWS